MENKKNILKSGHHFIVGFFLTIEGYDKFHRHNFVGGLILFFGIALLLYFAFEVAKKKDGLTLKLLTRLFEALALLFVTYIFLKDGKTYLPFVTFAASTGFFVSVFMLLPNRHKQKDT